MRKMTGYYSLASSRNVKGVTHCHRSGLRLAFAQREGEPIKIRSGINGGEPIAEDSDLFGAAVIAAARIAANASGVRFSSPTSC
jgi:class 3 adenylate cyclase